MANLKKKSTAKIKTKSGSEYSYKYTELADINSYIESINETYYQYIERLDSDDYIMTVRVNKDGTEKPPRRGLRVIQPVASDNNSIYQVQGIGTTYERRYSLLMAYGLATEDNDANELNKNIDKPKIETKEEAENYIITFGKHKGETLKQIALKDFSYIEWLLESEKTDEVIKNAIKLMSESLENEQFNEAKQTDEVMQEKLLLPIENAIKEKLISEKYMLDYFKVKSLNELNMSQIKEIYKIIERREQKVNKEKEEVF